MSFEVKGWRWRLIGFSLRLRECRRRFRNSLGLRSGG